MPQSRELAAIMPGHLRLGEGGFTDLSSGFPIFIGIKDIVSNALILLNIEDNVWKTIGGYNARLPVGRFTGIVGYTSLMMNDSARALEPVRYSVLPYYSNWFSIRVECHHSLLKCGKTKSPFIFIKLSSFQQRNIYEFPTKRNLYH